jgi:RHS repeat-associated protein
LPINSTTLNGSSTQNNGNPTQIGVKTAQTPTSAQSTFTQTFAYDSLNRLCVAAEGVAVSACNGSVAGSVWAQQSGYDRYGNMSGTSTGLGTAPPLPSAGSFDVYTNRLLNSYGGTNYDAAGNQTALSYSSLAYDAENRQKQDTESATGTAVWTYTYDGAGQRVMKALTGGGSTTYVHDAFGNLAAEYTTGSTPASPCATCYLSWDHLGSTRMVTDASGAVVAKGRHDYLPFGYEVPGNTGARSATTWGGPDYLTAKYTGAERDAESGFDYLSARYHAGMQGRFLSADPGNAGADLGNPQSWNGYSYVLDNPLANIDPTGLSCVILDNGTQGDDGDGLGCEGAGVEPGNPNNPDTITPQTIDITAQQPSFWENLWAPYVLPYYEDDVPLNSNAQQLFRALGQKIDAYPKVCSVGVTATAGLPGSRLGFGVDANSEKGVRPAQSTRIFPSPTGANLPGGVQGSLSQKGSSTSVSLSVPIPDTPLRVGVGTTNGTSISSASIGARIGRFLNLQGYVSISSYGDPNCH